MTVKTDQADCDSNVFLPKKKQTWILPGMVPALLICRYQHQFKSDITFEMLIISYCCAVNGHFQ